VGQALSPANCAQAIDLLCNRARLWWGRRSCRLPTGQLKPPKQGAFLALYQGPTLVGQAILSPAFATGQLKPPKQGAFLAL
jgi:hypothetical protein